MYYGSENVDSGQPADDAAYAAAGAGRTQLTHTLDGITFLRVMTSWSLERAMRDSVN